MACHVVLLGLMGAGKTSIGRLVADRLGVELVDGDEELAARTGGRTAADIAADEGIDAIALSNHGGRQLDSAAAIADLVAPVADAVGDRTEIICDGGVRRGSDIVKAVALGARACMAGRAYLYGLGAAGERGVDHVLGMFDADLRRTMALIGAHDVEHLTRAYVSIPTPR